MDAYDISRDIFDPKKHYTGVRMQQGRVLTDDDWNENERIDDEDKRRARIDVIGPYGSPDDGYKIENVVLNPDGTFDLTIDPGILYLGGLRLHHGKETYRLQNDWLEQPATAYTAPTAAALANGPVTDLVYLEAWEQGASAVEDGELFEPALGGPDTTTRVRNMARVRIASGVGGATCVDAWTQLKTNWSNAHLGTVDADYELVPDSTLKVSFPGSGLPNDLCSPQVAGGYLGAENQAIRVQLRQNSLFTWGFDDASPLYRVTVAVAKGVTTVTMLTLPKDAYHWPLSGQVVEFLAWSTLLPDGEKLAAREGPITTVLGSFDPGTNSFTINGALPAGFGLGWQGKGYPLLPAGTPVFVYLRVWNRGTDTGSPAEIAFTPGVSGSPGPAVTLGNTGLAIQLFGTAFLPGDYWVIAARPETPDQVMPWALALTAGIGIAPMGIRRFVAPLALLQWTLSASGQVTGVILSDCRKPFKPLTDLGECCCTFTVGDGVISKGDFNSIQAAVNALPAYGGKICILAGIHHDTVTILNRRNIEICGCGPDAIIVPGPPDSKTDPADVAVFSIISSGNIKLCNLTVLNVQGSDVAIYRQAGGASGGALGGAAGQAPVPGVVCGVRVENCLLLGARYLVYSDLTPNTIANGNIRISNNRMGQFDVDGRVPAIFTLGDDVLIERNRIVVIPAPGKRNPNNPGQPGDPTGCVFDPCCDKNPNYGNPGSVTGTVGNTATYVCGVTGETAFAGPYTAQGGIQIGSTSERVKIIQNTILGGAGIGISFGHLLLNRAATGAAPSGVAPSGLATGPSTNYENFNVYANYNATFTAAAVNENFNGSIYDILIAENMIELMGLSGIGVAAVFSLANIGLVFRVDGLGIYRNTITRCALQTAALQEAANAANMGTELAFGGIVLGAALKPIIRENDIHNNGLNAVQPVCGIFVLYGEMPEITHNRVFNNGVLQKGNDLVAGNRGGIVIRKAVQLLDAVNAFDVDVPGFVGIPAANIAGNEVDQPVGLALYLVALGQVSVLGNRFTARAVDSTNPEYILASTILIIDLGISKDLLAILINLLGNFIQIGQTTIGNTSVASVEVALLRDYYFLPGGRVLFANNQVSYLLNLLNRGGKIVLDSQLIGTLDDIAYLGNQSEITGLFVKGLPAADATLFDTVLFGFTVRSNDNRWQEGLSLVGASLYSLGLFNTCADNQASRLLLPKAATAAQLAVDNNLVF